MPTDIPLAGDWDGDGKDTVGIFSSNGEVGLTNVIENDTPMVGLVGTPSSIPVVSKWGGTRVDSIIYVSGNNWAKNSLGSSNPQDEPFHFGEAKSVPLAGIWEIR